MHHEDYQFGHFLFNSVEHLLYDLDRLVSQKLAFVTFLVLKRSTPSEQPAHEHISLLVLHIELVLSLLSSAHFRQFLHAVIIEGALASEVLLLVCVKLFWILFCVENHIGLLHHELLAEYLRHRRVLVGTETARRLWIVEVVLN